MKRIKKIVLFIALLLSFTSISPNMPILSSCFNGTANAASYKTWTEKEYTGNGYIRLTVQYAIDSNGDPYITRIDSYGCSDPNYTFYQSSVTSSEAYVVYKNSKAGVNRSVMIMWYDIED